MMEAGLCLTLLCVLLRPVGGGCVLPLMKGSPVGFQPKAIAAGPQEKLVIVDQRGVLLFADMKDFTVQQDFQLSREMDESNIQGLAMTNRDSTYLYAAANHDSELVEYEWHSSHKVFRRFKLLGVPSVGQGLQSLTFVPTPASSQEGYFYASAGISGDIYIYEVPLLSEGLTSARSVKVWSPDSAPRHQDHHVTGLEYADGYLFVCYDMGSSAYLLIFEILPSGLPGPLQERHQATVGQRPLEVSFGKSKRSAHKDTHI